MCGERELDGPAVIGMDKACVEDCKGEDFMGMQGKMGGGKWQGKKKGFLSSLNTKTLAERKYFFIEKKLWKNCNGILSRTPVFSPPLSAWQPGTIQARVLSFSPDKLKTGEALRGRRERVGEGSVEIPCTSENLEELKMKAMQMPCREERGIFA